MAAALPAPAPVQGLDVARYQGRIDFAAGTYRFSTRSDDGIRVFIDGDRIIDEPLSEALSRRYLAYALSTITARALPDARDGLKPVHRRVLYSMSQLGLNLSLIHI